MTAWEFARGIIEGVGGMNSFEQHEEVIWHHPDRVAAAIWTMRCLANPECEGSAEALASIIEARARGGSYPHMHREGGAS